MPKYKSKEYLGLWKKSFLFTALLDVHSLETSPQFKLQSSRFMWKLLFFIRIPCPLLYYARISTGTGCAGGSHKALLLATKIRKYHFKMNETDLIIRKALRGLQHSCHSNSLNHSILKRMQEKQLVSVGHSILRFRRNIKKHIPTCTAHSRQMRFVCFLRRHYSGLVCLQPS